MGTKVGDRVGLLVGFAVGFAVGFTVGFAVGDFVGGVSCRIVGAGVFFVGALVGGFAGAFVGWTTGVLVGLSSHSTILLALARTFSGHQLRALHESNASPQFCSTSLTTFLHAFCTSLTVLTVLHAFFAALASHRS